ncbi:hypothetical protein IQ06DRAFT_342375 [Phaeosphaeriaceae sp. SRC1lsM3a]|nr:hypothetical protein IQ06DRAFT_342375 [Stagonospora sp. SRC1lsM3a]
MPASIKYAFTLHVDLAPPLDYGTTFAGDRRFIPILGGQVEGPCLNGEILSGGGDWNAVRADGVVHILAKYSIKTNDGVLIYIHNEGYGRANQADMKTVFGNDPSSASMKNGGSDWYTKTFPRFEVGRGPHEWLTKSCFLGDLLPPERPNHVKIDVYEVL